MKSLGVENINGLLVNTVWDDINQEFLLITKESERT